MNTLLPQSFFNRSAVVVARELLGCYLVRKNERYLITEAEAYEGHDDLASHASRGRTVRTEIMFGHPGFIYIYLIYGMYWMLNIVTGEKGHPAAVLIRGVEGISGPGKLTKKLGITKSLNGKKLGKESGLWIEKGLRKIPAKNIEKTARIGVDHAGPVWAKKEWRFVIKQ